MLKRNTILPALFVLLVFSAVLPRGALADQVWPEQSISIDGVSFVAADCELEFTLSYPGGCGMHRLELELSEVCTQSIPLGCSLRLRHRSNDFCESFAMGATHRLSI